ncbi:MAG: hypothetical protein ABIK28_13105 [Planctomycetota bacterium]
MKVSTILLTMLFTSAVFLMGMRPPHHGRSVPFDSREDGDRTTIKRSHFQGQTQSSSDSAQLKQLKAREAKLRDQIREVENVLQKIETSKQYLMERMIEWKRDDRFEQVGDPTMEKALLAVAGESQEMLMRQLKELEADEVQFMGFLEQCRSEQATLKVKVDLYDLSAKRDDLEKFFSQGEKASPIEKINETRMHHARTSW